MPWPLRNIAPMFPDGPGRFAACRRHDIHTGVDFYCERGTEVQAIRSGIVVAILNFTGPNATRSDGTPDPMPWWNDTKAVMVEDKEGVWVYAEIETDLKVGDKIKAGGYIGRVIPVLTVFKGRPMSMLHMERHSHGSRDFSWWHHGKDIPSNLRNPTDLLIEAAKDFEKVTVFDLSTYDGKMYR